MDFNQNLLSFYHELNRDLVNNGIFCIILRQEIRLVIPYIWLALSTSSLMDDNDAEAVP